MCLCQFCPDLPRLLSSQGVRGQTKKGEDIMYDLDSKINFAVFPGLQVCPSSLRTGPTMDRQFVHPMFGRRRSCTCTLRVSSDVIPLLQGGPHNHTISGLACALKQATTPEFKEYQEQVLRLCTPKVCRGRAVTDLLISSKFAC